MGMGIIFSVIIGIMMTITAGTQVLPSYIEKTKISKVENRTIANQNTIKEAIIRYIEVKNKLPKTMQQLQEIKYIKDYHLDNLFGGSYDFFIDKENEKLIIYTNIFDDNATKYFKNTTKFPIRPICVELIGEICKDNLWKTVYPFDKTTTDIVNNIQPDLSDHFSKGNLGKKEYHKDNPPKDGDKDYVVPDGNGNVVEVYKCIANDCATNPNSWTKEEDNIIVDGGIGSKTGVFISNLPIPYHVWNEETNKLKSTSEQHEKVHCKDTTLSDKEVFVVNKNTGLGEIVWVAPSTSSVSKIQTKIFTNNYTPNNICTSNVTDMLGIFKNANSFDQPLNRWDTSRVTNMTRLFDWANSFNQPLNWDVSSVINMEGMFSDARIFNQPLNFDTSNVKNMKSMFNNAKSFNKPLNSWDTSNVTNMSQMFRSAPNFTQPLNNWNTSKVIDMREMFRYATNFNQPLDSWDTSNVTNMYEMFYEAQIFNQDLSGWCVSKINPKPNNFDTASGFVNQTSKQPIWGTCP